MVEETSQQPQQQPQPQEGAGGWWKWSLLAQVPRVLITQDPEAKACEVEIGLMMPFRPYASTARALKYQVRSCAVNDGCIQ